MATTPSRPAVRALSAAHNLPARLTSLVGRERELQGISEALGRGRLVTLSGPGGVGKTRLALEVAHRRVARHAADVWLVDLAAGSDAPDVAGETARVLDIRTPRGTIPTDALCKHLADADLLVILDNCEHVVGACAELADAVLTSCSGVRIMTTSREILDVSGERVWRLEPLGADAARRLFVERARHRRPEFMPDERDDAAIDRLCERLDRLPLAIELAAARIGVISLEEILSGLEGRLGALSGGGRFAPRRHRTVRWTVEWSHQLLGTDEQAALRAFAVFVGGFDADAAMAVAPGLSVEMLARLVDKSLVSVTETARGRTRYRLLETVREHEHGLLAAAGELDAARARHLRHYFARAETERDSWPSLSSARRLAVDLHDDYENVRAALEWAAVVAPCTGLALYVRTWELFQMLGQPDGVRLGELLLEACPVRDRTRAIGQISLGGLRMLVDPDGVWAVEEEARQLSAELGDRALEGWARLFQGLAAMLGGALAAGRDALIEARDLHREAGVRSGEGKATAALGLIEMLTGHPERAQELVEEALEIQAATGDLWSQGQCHTYLGMIAQDSGFDPSRATEHYRRAVDSLRPFRDAALLPAVLAFQGGVLGRRDPVLALKVVAAASTMRARAGGQFPPVFAARVDRIRSAAEAALGTDAQAVWSEGSRLSVDEAISCAFETVAPRATAPAGLSAREVEVTRLVADGLSNKAIASKLQLSVRTVESHVRNALTKVGLDNRTQLAAWARARIQ